jgi:hypothetical protein
MRLLPVFALLLAFNLAAKDRDWRNGTIADAPGSTTNVASVEAWQGRSNVSLVFIPHYKTRETYVIGAEGERFTVTRTRPSNKAAQWDGTDTVRFAVDKDRVYVLDSEGREHKFKLVR